LPQSVSPATSVKLPDGREVAVYLVELEDGRLVARTADELELVARPPAPEAGK
jgi:hypothetical protein